MMRPVIHFELPRRRARSALAEVLSVAALLAATLAVIAITMAPALMLGGSVEAVTQASSSRSER